MPSNAATVKKRQHRLRKAGWGFVTLQLEPALHAALQQACKATGKGKSQLIRECMYAAGLQPPSVEFVPDVPALKFTPAGGVLL